MTDMQIRACGAAEGPVIRALAGEIDLANTGDVEARLRAYVASTTGDVRVDCRELEFIDSSGLECLVQVRQTLGDGQRRFVITNLAPPITLLFEATGLDQVFAIE